MGQYIYTRYGVWSSEVIEEGQYVCRYIGEVLTVEAAEARQDASYIQPPRLSLPSIASLSRSVVHSEHGMSAIRPQFPLYFEKRAIVHGM